MSTERNLFGLSAFELAAAKKRLNITRRADRGHETVLGQHRIERNRRSNDIEIGFSREHEAFGAVARRAGYHLGGKRLRLRYVVAACDPRCSGELGQIQSRIGQ